MTTLNVIIALGAIGALVGVFEATVLHYDDLNKRPEGSLGHYMTYAGIIMLVLGAAVARFVFYAKERLWPAIAIPALAVALGATFARNAWVGTVAAISVVLALRQIKLLLLVPVVVVLFFVAAPAHVKDRVYSIVDMHDPTSLDRRAMLESGVHMVRDHPLFGVGMNMVPTVYPQYKTADAFDPVGATGVQTRSHLHNVPMQLAAERGVPAALCWLWFVIVALRDLITQVRRGPAKALAAVGVTAVVGMVVAGMFEHNFGDSEFLILFLGLISLAFAARQGATTDARVAS
jgi:O-antigen ligase